MAKKRIDVGQLRSGRAKYDDRSSMILDGSSCVSDDSSPLLEDGTAAITLISQNVAGLVDGLATYLNEVATAFEESDLALSNQITSQTIETFSHASAPGTVKNKGYYDFLSFVENKTVPEN